MSTIGGGVPLVPLAGSAGGQLGLQRAAGTNHQVAQSQTQAQHAAREAQLERSIGDVGESEGTGDRDADGREAWRWQRGAAGPATPGAIQHPHSVDVDGECGGTLDIEA